MTAFHQNFSHQHPFHAHPLFHEEYNGFFRDHPFFRGGPPPPPHFLHPSGPHGMHKPLRFLRDLAFVTLSIFCISMVFRSVVFLLALSFFPPVIFVCLLTLVAQTSWEQHPVCRYFNVSRLHHALFGVGGCRRIHRFRVVNECGGGRIQQFRCRQPGQSNTTPLIPYPISDGTTPRSPEKKSSSKLSSDSVPSDLQRHSPRMKNYQNIPVYREETEDLLTLVLDVSGYTLNDIKVTMVESATLLCIDGERKNRINDTFAIQEKIALDEEAYNLDDGSIHANLSDGVLEIKIQKKPVPQPRIISISTKKDD